MGWYHICCILDIPMSHSCSMGFVLGSRWTQIRHTSLPLPRHAIHIGIWILPIAMDGHRGTRLCWLGQWKCGRYPDNGCGARSSERASTSRFQHHASGLDHRKYIWPCGRRLSSKPCKALSTPVREERVFQKVPLRLAQYCCVDTFYHRGDNWIPVSSGWLHY